MSLSSAITKKYDTYSGNLPVAEAPTESSQLPLSSMNTWWNKLEVSASANQRWQQTAWMLTLFVNMAMAFKFNRVNPVTCLTTMATLSFAGAARRIIFVKTKVLSRQAYFCCSNKGFVATSILSSRQAYFCHNKRHVCHDKHMFLQNFCHNKNDTYGSSHQWYNLTTTKSPYSSMTLCRQCSSVVWGWSLSLSIQVYLKD